MFSFEAQKKGYNVAAAREVVDDDNDYQDEYGDDPTKRQNESIKL